MAVPDLLEQRAALEVPDWQSQIHNGVRAALDSRRGELGWLALLMFIPRGEVSGTGLGVLGGNPGYPWAGKARSGSFVEGRSPSVQS